MSLGIGDDIEDGSALGSNLVPPLPNGCYDAAFKDLDLILLPACPDLTPNRHLYPVRTPRRDALRRFLLENGIQTLIHYPVPLPFQPALQRFVLPGQEFPAAKRAVSEILSLPLYPLLPEDCEVMKEMLCLSFFYVEKQVPISIDVVLNNVFKDSTNL
jgi:hypothetical protein